MDNNWIIDNLNYAFGVWNDKLTEMWSLLSQSPQAFKGGTIWQTIQTVNGAMQGIGYGLLVLFLAIGIFRSSAGFRDFQRPEHILRRVSPIEVRSLAALYPFLAPGELLAEHAPRHAVFRAFWHLARPDRFDPPEHVRRLRLDKVM